MQNRTCSIRFNFVFLVNQLSSEASEVTQTFLEFGPAFKVRSKLLNSEKFIRSFIILADNRTKVCLSQYGQISSETEYDLNQFYNTAVNYSFPTL